jgi:hypothetical protein
LKVSISGITSATDIIFGACLASVAVITLTSPLSASRLRHRRCRPVFATKASMAM